VPGDGQKGQAAASKVIALPRVRKTSLSLTLLEFSHALVLMLWVGSLAGFALVVLPTLMTALPTRELAITTALEIIGRSAILGCGAGAFLLLTTLLMHLFSLRATQSTLTQMMLLLVMTASAIVSQIIVAPKLQRLVAQLPAPFDSLAPDDPTRLLLTRAYTTETVLLLVQIVAGAVVMLFAVRRWYRYLPERRTSLPEPGSFLDPRMR
jgi:hypothetical protein